MLELAHHEWLPLLLVLAGGGGGAFLTAFYIWLKNKLHRHKHGCCHSHEEKEDGV